MIPLQGQHSGHSMILTETHCPYPIFVLKFQKKKECGLVVVLCLCCLLYFAFGFDFIFTVAEILMTSKSFEMICLTGRFRDSNH